MLFLLLPSLSFAETEDIVIREYVSGSSPFEFESRSENARLMRATNYVSDEVDNLLDLQETIHYNLNNYETNFEIKYIGDTSNIIDQVKSFLDDIFASDEYLHGTMSGWTYSFEIYSTRATIEFNVSYLTNKNQEIFVDREVSRIVSKIIDPKMSDWLKVKSINDYIVLNTEYSTDSMASPHTAFALFKEGKAVCQGYALAAYKMLEEAGFEVRYVVGEAGGIGHAWNLVKINGDWYNLDTTWNDPIPNRPAQVRYNYFLVTDDILKLDHTWEASDYPSATSDDYYYMHEMVDATSQGNEIYYSNLNDNNKLYKMNLNTLDKEGLNNARSLFIVANGDTIYYSNYSDGGYLYSIKTNGSENQRLNNTHSVDLYKEGSYLYYTNKSTGKEEFIELEKILPDPEPEPEEPGEYNIWESKETNAPLKEWTIRFNQGLDKNSLTDENIYILNEDKIRVQTKIEFSTTTYPEAVVIRPLKEYNSAEDYTLFIGGNIRSASGKGLGKPIQMPFKYLPSGYVEVVKFADSNLEMAIRERINKPSGDILSSDVESISGLSLYDKGIKSLDGIEALKGLVVLNLECNHIEDIRPLAELKSLVNLNLCNNYIKDISPLNGLKSSLKYLDLSVNRIENIDTLSELKLLESLYLNKNEILDASSLNSLSKLKSLCLSENLLLDFSSLAHIYYDLHESDFKLGEQESINLSGILMGDSRDKVIKHFGNPDRIDDSGKGYDWYVYNKDYSEYVQVGILKDKVVAMFSTRDILLPEYGVTLGMDKVEVENRLSVLDYNNFIGTGSWYNSEYKVGDSIVLVYYNIDFDERSGDYPYGAKVSGVYVEKAGYAYKEIKATKDVIAGLENQSFDLANVARRQHNLSLFVQNKKVQSVARDFSNNLAYYGEKDYYEYTPMDFRQMLENAGISSRNNALVAMSCTTNAIELHYKYMESDGQLVLLSKGLTELGSGIFVKDYGYGYRDLVGTQIAITTDDYMDDFYISDEDKKDAIVYSHEVKGKVASPLEVLDTEEVELVFLHGLYNFNFKVKDIPEWIDFSNIGDWEIVVTDGQYSYRYISTAWTNEVLPYDIAHESFFSTMVVELVNSGYAVAHNGSIQIEFDRDNKTVRMKGITPNLFDPNNIESIDFKIRYSTGYEFKEFGERIK